MASCCIPTAAAKADSGGRRNTLIEGCVVGRPVGWSTRVTGRAAMRSPGRPMVNVRGVQREFWRGIAKRCPPRTPRRHAACQRSTDRHTESVRSVAICGTWSYKIIPSVHQLAMINAASPFALAADLLFPKPNTVLRDPVGWVRDRLGEFMWSKQREVCQSVVDHRYTAVKSCHDSGKSFTASRLAAWWLDVYPGKAFVVTTAPTTAQVEAILWREIGKAHRKAGLPRRITLDVKWYIGQELVAYGR